MKILFLTSRQNSPSFRFRVLQYLPYFERAGFTCRLEEIPQNWTRRILWLFRLEVFDVIFLQRKLLGQFELRRLRKKARTLVYDFDDAMMFKCRSGDAVVKRHREKRFGLITKNADLVIAGNVYLKNMAEKFSSNVIVIPTVIDTERLYPGIEHEKGEVVIGWIGTKSTVVYLNMINRVLEKIQSDFKDVRFEVISDDFSGLDIKNAVLKKWDYAKERSLLQGFSIGLMPLTDNAWTRGKCGFKIIQYFSLGIPVVCSPVGANCTMVSDGVTGFFARSEKEWYEKIATLINDKELRARMGSAARDKVKKEYSLRVYGPRLVDVLKNTPSPAKAGSTPFGKRGIYE